MIEGEIVFNNYVKFDNSFEWYDWYKVAPDMKSWDILDASYSYEDYF